MLNIVKIKLHNFKRFGDLTVDMSQEKAQYCKLLILSLEQAELV